MSGVVYRSGRIFDSLEEFVHLADQIWGSESQTTAFRGHANQDWQLVPSLFRTYTSDNGKNFKHFVNNRATTWQFISDLMQSNIIPTHLNLNYLQLLAVAQHYKEYPNACGTELLDFSWSPKVAASFAFQHEPTSEIGAIYLVNVKEISDLYLGVVEEIDLPDFFMRPNRQKATFLRQFNIPMVNLKGLLDIYYFRQNRQWPSNLEKTYTQNYLLEAPDDPVLEFAKSWHPYVNPQVDEGELQMLLQQEFYLLAEFGQAVKDSTWAWLDTFQEILFHVFRGTPEKAMYLKNKIDLATVKDDLLTNNKMGMVRYMLRRIETVCAIQQGQYRIAEQQIKGELSTAITDEDEIVLLNEQGGLYLQEKNFGEALKTYRKAEELSQKQDVQSVYNVGIALKALGRYQEAVVQFNWVVFELNEKDAESWQERANALNNLGQFQMAIDSTERALDLNPNLPYAWGHQAVAYLQMGNFERGEIGFKRMLEIRPDNDWALFNLTSALYYQRKHQEASQILERLRRTNPTYPRIELLATMLAKK